MLMLIPNDIAVAQVNLPKIVWCKCRETSKRQYGSYRNTCTYWKYDFKCVGACDSYHGVNSKNAEVNKFNLPYVEETPFRFPADAQ